MALKLSLAANAVLFVGLYVMAMTLSSISSAHHDEIGLYQKRAIAAGYAAEDDTGTFYWIKK